MQIWKGIFPTLGANSIPFRIETLRAARYSEGLRAELRKDAVNLHGYSLAKMGKSDLLGTAYLLTPQT